MKTALIIYWIFSIFANAIIFYLLYKLALRIFKKYPYYNIYSDMTFGFIRKHIINPITKPWRIITYGLFYLVLSPAIFSILLPLSISGLISNARYNYKKRKQKAQPEEPLGPEIEDKPVNWMEEIDDAFPDHNKPDGNEQENNTQKE